MAKAMQMPPDVEARIRQLPGNGTCADCPNVNPQWASVTYGTLVCLECSGQHRSLGVHLSFVRSVQMDSWTEKQIAAMEKSGGNESLVKYLSSKGIEQDMLIATKYNTPQATYYRERLSRLLEGKTEPPPDPGNYDPLTGGGDAQGAEPLPGETTEEYNARQARLRETARERLKAKFGEGGMGGIGSDPQPAADDFDFDSFFSGGQETAKAGVAAVGNVVSGGIGFLKSNVIENTDLHTKVKGSVGGAVEGVKGTVGGVTEKATGLWSSLKQQVETGDLVDTLKKNATAEEGSAIHKGFGWGLGAATNLWKTASESVGDVISGTAKPCDGNHQLSVDPRNEKCSYYSHCKTIGTRYSCSRACCEHYVCPKCFEKPPPCAQKSKASSGGGDGWDDDGWGDWEEEKKNEPPPEVTVDDMERLKKELGMNMSGPDIVAAPPVEIEKPKAEAKPKAKAKPADPDDFFADFGI